MSYFCTKQEAGKVGYKMSSYKHGHRLWLAYTRSILTDSAKQVGQLRRRKIGLQPFPHTLNESRSGRRVQVWSIWLGEHGPVCTSVRIRRNRLCWLGLNSLTVLLND